jgi:hypothetical protein
VLLPRGAPALRHTACPVRRAFSAIATVTLTCDACGAATRSRELSRALSLEVPAGGPGAPPVDVASLLARAFAAETGVERACEACGGRSATLARALHRLPRVLVLHLKRFKATPTATGGVAFTKCCRRVAAPATLSLAPHVRGAGAPRPPPALVQPAVATAGAPASGAAASAPASAWAEAGDDSDLAAALAASAADADARAAAAENAALAEALAASAADAEERALAGGAAASQAARPPPDADAETPRPGGGGGGGGHADAADVAERLSDSEESSSPRRAPENVSLSYKLHGLVSHVGASAAAGHYTADVLDAVTRVWRRHDDARVSTVSEAAVFSEAAQESAYLLVYVHVPDVTHHHGAHAAARPAHAGPLQRQP